MGNALPPLDSLRILAVCVRHGNFSRAAAELGITPTAVSQRIRALEAQIGIELFSRNGPRLVPTGRAKALGEKLEHALSLMRAAVDDCRRVSHPLRVTCAPTFAARWLVPRLATYQSLPGADAITLNADQNILPRGDFDPTHVGRSGSSSPAFRMRSRSSSPRGFPTMSWKPRQQFEAAARPYCRQSCLRTSGRKALSSFPFPTSSKVPAAIGCSERPSRWTRISGAGSDRSLNHDGAIAAPLVTQNAAGSLPLRYHRRWGRPGIRN
jgi:hypothetical protein